MTTETQLFAKLKDLQQPDTRVQITIVIKPNRGSRNGDGSGTQSRIAVHAGDTFSGPLVQPISYADAGTEQKLVKSLVKKFGKARVALEVKDGQGKRTYESTVIE